MEFKNEHIVIGIIIIITVFFIINYDVYVLSKDEPLCKPVYVTKKVIDDKMIKKLKNPKELFKISKNKIKKSKKLIENEEINEDNLEIDEENIKEILVKESCVSENLQEENKNNNKNIIRKKIIINNMLNILPNIPTVLKEDEIHDIINYISNVYLASTSMAQFYNNINNYDKISPKNSNYVKLILYLIDNFDSSIPIDFEPNIRKPTENNFTPKAENDDNMFLISNSNSPIQSRMMQQASFIR